jgi:hypothetical protein
LFTPQNNRKLIHDNPGAPSSLDHSHRYKNIGRYFSLDYSILSGEMFLDHAIVVMKAIFDKYPLAHLMPRELDYSLSMLIRNLLIWMVF